MYELGELATSLFLELECEERRGNGTEEYVLLIFLTHFRCTRIFLHIFCLQLKKKHSKNAIKILCLMPFFCFCSDIFL